MSPATRVPVLFVDPGGGRGGGERVIEELAKACSGTRFKPVVVSLASGDWPEDLASAGIEAHVVQRRSFGRFQRELRVVARLITIARGSGAQIIHANLNSSLLYASVAARICRLPLVWHLHDPLPTPTRSGKRLAAVLRLLRPDFIIFANSTCVESWQQLLGRPSLPPHRILVPGIDPGGLSSGRPARARSALGLQPDSPVIAMFARYAAHKGHEDLIKATAVVRRSVPSVQVVICTVEDPAPADLERLVQLRSSLGLEDSVVLAGGVSEQTRIDLLAAMSALAHPARFEPFGLAILEAMAAGKPVVAAASDGARYLLEDGRAGVLVPPGNPDLLGAAISELLDDPQRRQRIGEAGYERSLLFTLDAMAEGVFSIWTEVLEGRRKPRLSGVR